MTFESAVPANGLTTASSTGGRHQADPWRVRPRQRSGWLTAALRSAGLPSGIPPGRSRPEPGRDE